MTDKQTELLCERNPVAEVRRALPEVSLKRALVVLQLHNVQSKDDPYQTQAQQWLQTVLARTSTRAKRKEKFAVDLLRTCLLMFKGWHPAMLEWFLQSGLMQKPEDV